jgi:RNA polymerase sigma-B factor
VKSTGTPAKPASAGRRSTRVAADRALIERARREGTADARRAAVEGLLPLARALARRYHRGSEPLEDLEQVATIGLLKAIDGFDLDRDATFSAYAVPTIVGELRRHFRDKGWTVRVPRELQELSLRVSRAENAMFTQLGRAPTAQELSDRLEVSVERVLEARGLTTAMHPVSLDRPLATESEGEGVALLDTVGTLDDGYARTDDTLAAKALLRRLPDRERAIIELRFGEEELSQSEIGARLGISQMQVSRLLRRTLDELGEAAAA